jgi:tetratricopeptide (TPR) repeat protein
MRLPVATRIIAGRNQFACLAALSVFCLCLTLSLAPRLIAQGQLPTVSTRDRIHQSEQWMEVERHLPDPATASPQALEQQADILRARRFPEDAMDYYKYAMARGGNVPSLTNKLGLTELEMKNIELARSYFQRAVKLNKKDGEAWNNLGAVEFLDGQNLAAVSDYKKAIKLEKRQAVYHANLANAYFETKNYNGARREIAEALKLDPQVFERREGVGGVAAHVLSSQDRARLSFEMAKMYARSGMQEEMLHSLAMAAEAGMDVQREMLKDPDLGKYDMDPRVLVLVHNAQLLRTGHAATLNATGNSDAGGAPSSTNPL